MKKLFMGFLLSFVSAVVFAVPALRGQWKLITLDDGTQVKAQLVGDEYGHFWRGTDGNDYRQDALTGAFVKADTKTIMKEAGARRAAANKKRAERRKAIAQPSEPIVGKKKGLLLLVQFKGETFEAGAAANKWYSDMMNKEGFYSEVPTTYYLSDGSTMEYGSVAFRASVRDYFMAVSDGQLDLDFDVVGPIQLSREAAYYGKNYNNISAQDLRPEVMVKEACDAADEQVNFADYDWNGDGEVDQLVVIYSGLGENAGGEADRIWAHEYWLSYTDVNNYQPLEYDGMKIDTYACSPEQTGIAYSNIPVVARSGIGTLCHEFSHCLGLPDMYDTGKANNYGMWTFSIMDQGNYNGFDFPGYNPAEYTAYERMYVGWKQPVELTDDVEVSQMAPISKGGDTYIFYNDANPNEYFLLENRQHANDVAATWDDINSYTGYFDCALEGDGLLITHVDYDQEIWENNYVNTTDDYYRIGLSTDHPRCQVVPADGSFYVGSSASEYYDNIDGDLFPYVNNVGVMMNNAFKDGTKGAEWYNDNSRGDRKLHVALTDITQNSDLSISFKFAIEKVEDGIRELDNLQADGRRLAAEPVYSLSGQPVSSVLPKGVYIRGGKKFVVK